MTRELSVFPLDARGSYPGGLCVSSWKHGVLGFFVSESRVGIRSESRRCPGRQLSLRSHLRTFQGFQVDIEKRGEGPDGPIFIDV